MPTTSEDINRLTEQLTISITRPGDRSHGPLAYIWASETGENVWLV